MKNLTSVDFCGATTDMMGSSFCKCGQSTLGLSDLGGLHLKIGVMNYNPFFIKRTSLHQEVDGIEVQLAKEMARQLNFTYEFLVYEEWGAVSSNGSWIGGFGQAMQDNQVDIAMANIWQIPNYFYVVDFGPPLNKVRAVFLVLRPELVDFQWQTVLKIFKPQVWYCTLASSILITLMYWMIMTFFHSSRSESWTGSVLTVFGFFTMTTSHSRIADGSVRIILTSWSIFALLITTSLSSGIVSSLTLPNFSPRIDSIQQLVEGKFYWTLQWYVNTRNNTEVKSALFDLSNNWVRSFEKTYTFLDDGQLRKKAGVDKKMTIFSQTYGDDLAILDGNGLFEHKGLYNYRVAKEYTTEKYVSFGANKQSALLEPLTRVTLRVLESGINKYWKGAVLRRWKKYDTSHLFVERDIPSFGEPQPLQLIKLRPVFLLLLFGLCLSSFIFLIEMWWF